MSKPLISIHDSVSGETIIREMSDDEYAAMQLYREDSINQAKAFRELEAKRAAALAKLDALGIDADDLRALGL